MKVAMGRRHLTWDEVVRHSTGAKLICALLSPLKLEDVRAVAAHFALKVNEVARLCLLSSELLALWSYWPPLCGGAKC